MIYLISIIQEIRVEVSKPNFFQAIVAKQYDSNSRFLKATLIQDNEKINVANTSTVVINAKRNDGAEKSFTGEVNEDGTVTVPLAYWMLELNGTLECDISIFGADESKLTSTKFIVEVERASCQGGDVTDADKCDIVILQGQNIVGSVNGKTGIVELSAADVGAASKTEFETAVNEINVTLGGVADTIVETGTKDGWTYRKWSSGIAECWKTHLERVSANTTDNDVHVSFPFTFASVPFVGCSLQAGGSTNYNTFVIQGGITVSDVRLHFRNNYSGEAVIGAALLVKGRWK